MVDMAEIAGQLKSQGVCQASHVA